MTVDPAIIAAIIGLLGVLLATFIFFDYQFHKEKERDFIKKQIDELLLPLFIKMQRLDNIKVHNEDFDVSWEKIIEDDKYIEKIAIKKLNLASPTLSKLLLDFINYRYLNDKDIGIRHIQADIVEKNFLDLKQVVFDEYKQKVKEYQNMKPWWQFWTLGKNRMTLREKFKIIEELSLWSQYVIIGLLLLLALLGLPLNSLREIAKNNFDSIYFFIGTAITLSGFTMVSGIFEGKEPKPKLVKKLFFLSISFLFSAFSFIVFIGLYSGLEGVEINNRDGHFLNYITIGTYLLGILILFMGFLNLIIVLIQHYKQIKIN